MFPSSHIVKKTAALSMRENYMNLFTGSCFVTFSFLFCTLVSALVYTVFGNLAGNAVMVAVILFLVCPLLLGRLYFVRRMLWGQKDKPVLVFHYFSSGKLYLHALSFTVKILVRALAVGILFSIPSFTANLLSDNAFYLRFGSTMPSWAPNLWVLSSLLSVAAAIGVFFVMAKYFSAPFIFVANEEISETEAIKLSLSVSKNCFSDFIWFTLSMLGWIVLCIFAIPFPFVEPYLASTYSVFCRFALAHNNKIADKVGETSAPTFEP